MLAISKYITVDDNWYPTYPDNNVDISLNIADAPSACGKRYVIISVWGADDFFLELMFEGTMEECKAKYDEWKNDIFDKIPEVTNQEYFYNLGFVMG